MGDGIGTVLWRGGRALEVAHVTGALTVVRSARSAVTLLDGHRAVARVEPLTTTVTRVVLAPVADPESVRDTVMEELRSSRVVTHHTYVAPAAPAAAYSITDEVLVAFREGSEEGAVADLLTEAGLQVRRRYRHLRHTYLVRVTWAAGMNPLKVCSLLMQRPEVRYAEPAVVNAWRGSSMPTDGLLAEQWHLVPPVEPAPDVVPGTDVGASSAWQVTRGRRDVVVAVLDDGFDLTHPDLAGTGKVVHPVDFAGADAVPLPEPGDFHGTPCAGLAVAEAEGDGCVGVAPGAALMPVRISMNLPDPWLIEIFQHVSRHASVASCSFGPVPGDFPLHSAVSDTLSDVCARGGRNGNGLVVVVAAGNYNAPLNLVTDTPIRFDGGAGLVAAGGRVVNGLAAHPDTVTVSAYTSLGRRARYSGWGREVSVAAPGNNFDPVHGDALPGRGITTTDNEALGDGYEPGKRFTSDFGGTSAACAIVAGVAALVRSAAPRLSAREVKEVLEETARKVADPTRESLFGVPRGIYREGRSLAFGHGWVDAAGAVQRASAAGSAATVLAATATPRATIPDDFPPGVSDVVVLPGPGVVQRVEVDVDIRHPWPGDLRIVLAAPTGSEVVLADRWVTSTPDLRGTFSSVGGDPQLAALHGQPAQGAWALRVSDLAAADEGELRSWGLRVHVGAPGVTRIVGAGGARLPAGRLTALETAVHDDIRLAAVALHVDIGHPDAQRMRVALVSPTGAAAVVQDGAGAEPHGSLRRTFTPDDTPPLVPLGSGGASARGTWTLELTVPAGAATGKLNTWWLDLTAAP